MNRFERALSAGCFGVTVACGASAWAQTTERVSVDSGGAQSDGHAQFPRISADGRCVVFRSGATNLVPGDTNGFYDVFVHDRASGQTTRASVDSTGVEGDGHSLDPALSSDGRFVAFESDATNLVGGDTNGMRDAFVHDRVSGQTTRASVDSAGVQGDGMSQGAVVSDDGRYVAFWSFATNLVAGDTNSNADVFVHDRSSGQTVCASVDSGGVPAAGFSGVPSTSGDGRYVAFGSDAPDLVAGDTNDLGDVFLRDMQTSLTTRVSVSSSGVEADGGSMNAALSADGRFVAFESGATNLVSGDTNAGQDVFVRNLQTGQTTRVSVDSAGAQANGGSEHPAISADGRYVAFWSFATNLVPGDTNGVRDVFVHDQETGRTVRASVGPAGAQASGQSIYPSIAAVGPDVAFMSSATNLVTGDTNGFDDVFVHGPVGFSSFAAFCFGDGSLATPCPCAPPNTVPNPSGAPGHGCANSFHLAGALLSAAGTSSPDTLTFAASIAPGYVGFAFLVKGSAQNASGIANGDGVRCVDGALIRFGGHNAGTNGAAFGFWSYPNTAQTTPVSIATAQSGDRSAWYQLIYRNAAAGFCSSGTTNWTNGVHVPWPH